MHQMHQCTNESDSGAPDQVHFIGKFHLKVPDLDLLYLVHSVSSVFPDDPPAKNGFISQILHQCTRLWCIRPGTFHKQIPFKST